LESSYHIKKEQVNIKFLVRLVKKILSTGNGDTEEK